MQADDSRHEEVIEQGMIEQEMTGPEMIVLEMNDPEMIDQETVNREMTGIETTAPEAMTDIRTVLLSSNGYRNTEANLEIKNGHI
jgi:hypothetical protein